MSEVMTDRFEDLFDSVAKIAATVLDMDADSISPTLGPEDVDAWDSLSHLRIITAIEENFEIRLSMREVTEIKTLGDFARAIARHLTAA